MIILSGVDIVNNNRIKKLIERTPNAINDIFSLKEIEYCSNKRFSEQSFGVRFAAKEAIIKATDSHILEYELHEIETLNTESGKPVMNIINNRLINKIKTLLKKEHFTINISLSHEKEYSIAQIIIY